MALVVKKGSNFLLTQSDQHELAYDYDCDVHWMGTLRDRKVTWWERLKGQRLAYKWPDDLRVHDIIIAGGSRNGLTQFKATYWVTRVGDRGVRLSFIGVKTKPRRPDK